jgi:hypothetical protein
MNFENACRKLDELMVDLIKKGVAIPDQVIDDLKSTRTLINIYKSDPVEIDRTMETTPLLKKAEFSLMFLADTRIGKEYADEWQNKIDIAYQTEDGRPASRAGYVPGVPKGESWFRIAASELSAMGQDLEELLGRLHLSSEPQTDGYLLIHGGKGDIMSFLKEVRQKVGKSKV